MSRTYDIVTYEDVEKVWAAQKLRSAIPEILPEYVIKDIVLQWVWREADNTGSTQDMPGAHDCSIYAQVDEIEGNFAWNTVISGNVTTTVYFDDDQPPLELLREFVQIAQNLMKGN
jgi:hypothetical protein